jgi:CHAT domain-containing protein
LDTDLFLQNLRDLSLEEGKAYIQEHIDELADHAVIGKLLENEALHLLYSPFISLKIAELLIFYGEYVEDILSHALGLKAKGDALMMIGHHQAAIDALDAAGEEFLHLEDERNWARSRISWIYCSAWLGRVEEALRQAEQARNMFLKLGEPYWTCIIDHNRALIYEGIGRYQEALNLYERMRAIYPTLTDQNETSIQRSIALAEANQAIDLVRLGAFKRASQLFRQAQDRFTSLDEKDLTISVEIDLADLDLIQGYYGSALRRYYKARDSLQQSNDDNPYYLAELKLSIAKCLVKLDRSQEAALLASEAVESYRAAGSLLNEGNALRDYANTLFASNRAKEALIALDEAWMLLSLGGFEPHAFATKLQQAELLLEMGSTQAAYDQANIVREYFQSNGLAARSVHAILVMANALIENVQQAGMILKKDQQIRCLQEAKTLSKQAVLQAHQYHLQEEVYKSHYLLGRIFALENNLPKAMKHFGAAIAQIERILDDLVYDMSPSFLHTTWAVYEDMIDLCLQSSQAERAFVYLEQARSMALRQYLNKSRISEREEQEGRDSPSLLQSYNLAALRTKYELREEQEKHRSYNVLMADIDYSVSTTVNREVIEQELKRSEKKISDLFERLNLYETFRPLKSRKNKYMRRNTKQVDIDQLRQFLTPDHLLLAYYLHKGKLVIFAITAEGVVTHENLNGLAQLESLLPLFHAHLDPRGWSDFHNPPKQAVLRMLNKLYNLLIEPVAVLFPSSHGRITIVPYGPLHQLPLHALYDGSNYLVERFQINYVPTSNILIHLEAHEGEQLTQHAMTEISAKPPLIFGYSEKGHLKRVHEEAKAVASLLNGRYYLEDEATIAKLIELAPGTPIIHLATHGQSRLDAPNFSYVRLADGQLNAIDAFSLDLKACELVTLSGCETGLALSGGGDEQLGLGRAFLAAGASSLVMSLWSVEDNATNELMKLFYHNLLKGESKVQALSAAQCQLLHDTSSNYTHPYFWAAFRLVGDVTPLKIKEAKEWSLEFIIESLKK